MQQKGPGLYFVRSRVDEQIHIQEYIGEEWLSIGDGIPQKHPEGEIVSGPWTENEMLKVLTEKQNDPKTDGGA